MWAVAFSLLAVVAATPIGPTAALSVDDVTPVVGQIVHFDASASVGHDEGKGRIVSYEFDFGDGTGTREQSSPMASHAYSLVGPKWASVTVEDARGNEGSASVRIEVRSGSPPTGGTPDLTPKSAYPIPAQPVEGQVAILSITLANVGNATAEAATIDVTDQRPNGTVVAIGATSLSASLAPEASVVVYSPTFVAMGVGNHSLRIIVGNVTPAETDVEDNMLMIGMTVLPATGPPPEGAPDLAPQSVDTIPAHPVEGELVSLSITIVNRGTVAAESAIIDASDVRPNGTIVSIGTTVLSTPLEPGTSTAVSGLSFIAAGVGDHEVQVTIRSVAPAETDVADNTLTVRMTVLSATGLPNGGFTLDAALLAGGLAAAAVAALLVATWLLLTPREMEPLEPPPPEPPDDSPPPIRPP